MRALISAAADVNRTDPTGSAALHYAALLGNEPISEVLLRAGADRAVRDEDGKTAAQVAAAEGYDALAAMLR